MKGKITNRFGRAANELDFLIELSGSIGTVRVSQFTGSRGVE